MSTHYEQSPKMIHMQVSCNEKATTQQLKNMDIDRRWQQDNRISTWTFGMINPTFDMNFIPNAMIINDTDNRVQKILGDDATNNIYHDVIGTRNIKDNGNWFRVDKIIS